VSVTDLAGREIQVSDTVLVVTKQRGTTKFRVGTVVAIDATATRTSWRWDHKLNQYSDVEDSWPNISVKIIDGGWRSCIVGKVRKYDKMYRISVIKASDGRDLSVNFERK
jgi:hypothetical protein